jgi:hypothetical protein
VLQLKETRTVNITIILIVNRLFVNSKFSFNKYLTFAAQINKMKKLFTTLLAITAAIYVNAQCTELFFSEYAEGTGNNKALEIFNPTQAPISLSNYFIRRYSNGSDTFNLGGELALAGTIAPGGVWVVVNGQTTSTPTSPACDTALQAKANQLDHAYPAPTYMNGDDAIVLAKGSQKVDIFGKIGEQPTTAWSDIFPYTGGPGMGKWWTTKHTLVRKASVKGGVTTNPDYFNPTTEYDSLPKNTWTGLGFHTCDCVTGINEVPKYFVSVFPNPSNNSDVTLSTDAFVEKVELIDRAGRVVALFPNTEKIGQGFRFSTLGIQQGLFIVKAYLAKGKIGFSKLSIN